MLKLLVSVCVLLGAAMQVAPAQTDSKSSRQLYEQAAKAIASADSRAAISPLEQLIEQQPTSSLACIAAVHLAECYVEHQREGDAAALLENWSGRIAKASKTTKLDTNLDAHHLRVWLQAARRINDSATSIKSLETLTQALESRIASSHKNQIREALFDAHLEIARRLAASGKLEQAANQLRQLTESVTDASSEVQFLIAMIHQQLGDRMNAQKVL